MVGKPARGGLVAALALVFAAAGIAPSDTSLTVGKAAANADPIIPVNVGDELGIFKKHGLDLKIVDFTGGSKMTQAMAAGSIDIGDGAGTEMAFIAKGVPMMAVCEIAGPIPFLGIGVPWDSPIKSVDAAQGQEDRHLERGLAHRVAGEGAGAQEGLGAGRRHAVAIGNGAASIIAAFREHLVDADVGGRPRCSCAWRRRRSARCSSRCRATRATLASGTLYASNHLIETNPDAIRAFLAAWIETDRLSSARTRPRR